MQNTTLDTFLATTYTTSQIKRRLTALQFFLNSKIFGGTKSLTNIVVKDQYWIGSLGDNFFNAFNKKTISKELRELGEDLQKVPVLTILVPVELPEDKLSELGAWVRDQFKKQLILEVKINPGLIGGCALIWKGVYKDYSVKASIQVQQKEILGNFKRYLK